MKVGFIVPEEPELVLFPIYEEIKKSRRKLDTKIKELFAEYELNSIPSRGKSFKTAIGVLSIAGNLLETNHVVEVLHEEYSRHNESWNLEFSNLVRESDVIGITSFTKNYSRAVKLLMDVKSLRPDLPVVAGGPHASYLDADAITDGFDFVIRGEGDLSFVNLVSQIKGDNDFGGVLGLTYQKNGVLVRNRNSQPVPGKQIPNPAYGLIPQGMRDRTAIALFSSRGCPFSCNFCVEHSKYRGKDISKVIEDISRAKETFSFNIYFMSDSIFGVDNEYTRDLVSEIHKNFPDTFFFYQNRIDLIKPKMAAFMTQNNFIGMWVGLESLVDDTLSLMNKGKDETYDNYVTTLNKIKGIVPYIEASFIVGYPGDTMKNLNTTLERLEGLMTSELISSASVRQFIPYPGSDMFANPSKYGLTINSQNYDLYDRHAFPPIVRTRELSEFDIYSAILEFNSLVSRVKHRINGSDTYNSIDFASIQQYRGK